MPPTETKPTDANPFGTAGRAVVAGLVAQCHGRGPTGHAGVPEPQLNTFVTTYVDALAAQADAYDRWAKEYADYVEAAEDELVHGYGPEVLAAARPAHHSN